MTMEVKKAVEKRVEHQAGDNVAKVETQDAKVAAPEPQITLDSHIMLAIQTTVQEAMKTAVGTIIEQLKPATLPSTPAPSIPVRNAGAPIPVPASDGHYVSKLKGIPVEEGQDLRHVHPNVIQNWFNGIENRWKEAYNKRKIGGAPVDLSWTRG